MMLLPCLGIHIIYRFSADSPRTLRKKSIQSKHLLNRKEPLPPIPQRESPTPERRQSISRTAAARGAAAGKHKASVEPDDVNVVMSDE